MTAAAQILLINTIHMKFSFDKVHQAFVVNSDSSYAFNPNHPNAAKKFDNIEYVTFESGWFHYAELNDLNAQALEIKFAVSDLLSLVPILPTLKSGI